jgi:CheY-like chemotaxis protein
MINAALEMSKIEAGCISFEPISFDLYHTLSNLEGILREQASRKGLKLTFEISEDVPPFLRADELKLRQVLLNLLSNAIKFTDCGEVLLQVKVNTPVSTHNNAPDPSNQILPSDSISLRFEVQDTGMGIAPDELDQLFKAFAQTKSGIAVGEGAGLGLSISQHYVQLMGGEISVESQVGEGSTFSFVVPVEPIVAPKHKSIYLSKRVIGLVPGQPEIRILVVDDNQENQALLQQIHENAGFEVRTVACDQVALEIYTNWDPHLTWIDFHIPGMDSCQAARLIKESAEPARKVIAVTASAYEEEHARLLQVGYDDFLQRPFSENDIYDLLAKHLNVAYMYEDLAGPVISGPITLNDQELATLPEGWMIQLHQAASRGRNTELLALIHQIEASHQQLANTLHTLVNEFEFAQILDMTEKRI